ncbi:MAG: insulinase family protein [Proteobacteria bacterium]|nr:insulinase family protein [Pseudomonadota bacterium]
MTASRFALATVFLLLTALPAAAEGPRGAPPPPGSPPEARLPTVETFQLANELRVVLVNDDDLPLVRVAFVFEGAAQAEAANQRGLSRLTARLMLYGGVDGWDQDVDFFQERTEGLQVLASDSFTGFQFSCFPKDLMRALEEFDHLLASPKLAKKDVLGMIGSSAEQLAGSRANAQAVGFERVRKLVLKWHREEIDAYGSEATLLALTPVEVRSFHDIWFRPDQATLFVVGDIDRARLEGILDISMTLWTVADAPAAPVGHPAPPADARARTVLLHRGDVVQSQVFVAAPAPAANSGVLAALAVLAEALGGGIDSRLNRVLREERADSYGLGAYHEVMPDAGILWLTGAVDADATARSLEQILAMLDELGSTPMPPAELRAAQAVLEGEVMRGAATTWGLLGQLLEQVQRGRDPAALAGWIEEIRAVTPEAVQKAAARWLGPEARTVLVVGDANRITTSLEKLFGEVETKYRSGEGPAQ